MSADLYFTEALKLIEKIQATQLNNIKKAAKKFADFNRGRARCPRFRFGSFSFTGL